MTLPFLSFKYKKTDTYDEFIEFWSDYYIYLVNDKLYSDRINNTRFTQSDIQALFEWKNGMKVNEHPTKQISIDKVKSRIKVVNRLKTDFDLTLFENTFCDIGAIWQIFLLHVIQPTQFPIFDQHVYRAHIFLTQQKLEEISNNQKQKLEYYHNSYIPYFDGIKTNITDLRKIDAALWAFGKFLKTNYAKKLVGLKRRQPCFYKIVAGSWNIQQ